MVLLQTGGEYQHAYWLFNIILHDKNSTKHPAASGLTCVSLSLLLFASAGVSTPLGSGPAYRRLPVLASGNQLGPVQPVVQTTTLQELAVCAHLCHLATLDHSNLVCILDGGQAVGNHNAGAARLGSIKACLDRLFQSEERESDETGGLGAVTCTDLHLISQPYPLCSGI